MVRAAEYPRRWFASCCSVLVVNGGEGWREWGWGGPSPPVAGARQRMLHGLLGDLVELDAFDGRVDRPECVGEMPGDGLAFPVRIGRHVDKAGLLGGLFQLFEDRGLALDHDVARRKAIGHVHSEPAAREVLDVAHRGYHVVAAGQKIL